MKLGQTVREVFETFAEIYTQYLRCPTCEEIGSEVGIAQASVRSAMLTLMKNGLVEAIPGSRGYRLAGFAEYGERIREILSGQYATLAAQIDDREPEKTKPTKRKGGAK